jgi:iron complex outermembrane receptor protein
MLNVEYDLVDYILLYAKGGARDGSEQGIYGGVRVNDAETGDDYVTALYVRQ